MADFKIQIPSDMLQALEDMGLRFLEMGSYFLVTTKERYVKFSPVASARAIFYETRVSLYKGGGDMRSADIRYSNFHTVDDAVRHAVTKILLGDMEG